MNDTHSAKQQPVGKPLSWSNENVKKWLIKMLKFSIWLAGLYGSCFIYIQKIYFIVSWKRKQGQMSAYSVFNKGYKRLPGTFSAEEMFKGKTGAKPIEAKQYQKIMDQDELEKAKSIDQYFKNQSKFGNRPCYCGSDLKFKKCCLPRKKQQQQEQRKKRLQKSKDP